MTDELFEYEIRLMKREDIPQVLDLWRETNSVEDPYSIDTWYKYDPEGFYVAATNDGTIIGSCAGILQHNDLAFVGLYGVKPTFQRRGIGKKNWNKVMERVGDRNVGVDSVPSQVEKYRDRAGFPILTDWNTLMCFAKEIHVSEMLSELPGINIKIIKPDDIEAANNIAEYDADVLYFSRSPLISLLCKEKDTVTVMATNSHTNSVCGYGNIKQYIKGNALVAPLYADNSAVAELILYHMMKAFPIAESNGVTMMIIDCNEDAIALIDKLGFEKKLSIPRLYKSKNVEVQFQKVFGQHTLKFSVF